MTKKKKITKNAQKTAKTAAKITVEATSPDVSTKEEERADNPTVPTHSALIAVDIIELWKAQFYASIFGLITRSYYLYKQGKENDIPAKDLRKAFERIVGKKPKKFLSGVDEFGKHIVKILVDN